jgi:hypothetical protein
MEKKKLGRPRLPDEKRKVYKRVALYPPTHEVAKDLAAKSDKLLIDWFDDLVMKELKSQQRKAEKVDKQDEQKSPSGIRKVFPFLNK